MAHSRRSSPASGDQANDTARKVAGLAFSKGRLVEVTIDATGIFVSPHGLEGTIQGALIVGAAVPHTAHVLVPGTPGTGNIDWTRVFALNVTAITGSSLTLKVLVF